MPNKKKKRKNKEQAAAVAAAAANNNNNNEPSPQPPPPRPPPASVATTTTTPTAPPTHRLLCDHNQVHCDTCLFAVPTGTGCLHSLREDERNTAEVHEIIRVYLEPTRSTYDASFLPILSERLVRFFLYLSIKVVVGKETFFDMGAYDYKSHAHELFCAMLSFYGVIKCGSKDKKDQAEERQDSGMALFDESQASYRAMMHALVPFRRKGYHGLVCVLNELSSCNCLEAEVERSRLEEEQDNGQKALWSCANHCGKAEESYDEFSCCAGCKISFYCSGRCHRRHWKMGGPTQHFFSHKTECEAFQELVSFIRGDGDGDGDCAAAAASGTSNSNDDLT